MAAAETIENSFGQYMYSYRIGGDEFCVFLEGINIQAIYEKACNDFIKLISIKNKQLPPEFELQIAKGFEIYDINNVTVQSQPRKLLFSRCGVSAKYIFTAKRSRMQAFITFNCKNMLGSEQLANFVI